MNDTTAQLTIRLIGTPDIQIAGAHLLTLHDSKARALLFYLAFTRMTHTRDHLATLLWSESSDSNARHSLRSSLYHLRQALNAKGAGEALVGDGNLVFLRLDEQACDIHRFDQLLTEGGEEALTRAVSLYRGPLLQGFTLSDAPVFEEWVRFEEARLQHAYLGALKQLASLAEARQSWEEAIDYVQHMVKLDPLAEEIQRQLIQLYVRSGAIGKALHHYQQFEVELSQELGVAPSPQTQALFHEILRMQPGTTSLAKTSPRLSASSPEVPPLIGRDNLMGKLLTISQEVRSGRGATILLNGEDGIGKSRLLTELSSALLAESSPWIVLQGSCSPFDDLLSYGPFIEAFQGATPGDLTDLLMESYQDSSDAQVRFLWRVLQALQVLSRSVPLLITIDDMQWANRSTLHLFSFIARRLRNLPVMLVGAVHDIVSIPDLQRLVTWGRRRGDVHLVSVTQLTQEAVTMFLQSSGISSTSVTTLFEWLYERSGGNPFILIEILTQLRAERILTPSGIGWRLDTSRWLRWRSVRALPETIHDLVDFRLVNLSTEARYLLDVLAVADQPLPFALLQDFPGVQANQVLSMLEDLVEKRLVIETTHERFALTHPLVCETLIHHLSQLRSRKIHRQLVEIIEACPALRKDFPLRQIALHAVAGRDIERARLYGMQILAELSQDYVSTAMVDFVQHLYDLLAPTASLDEMLHLTHTLGQMHQSLGHLEAATDWHRRNLELARESGNPVAIASGHFEMGELALVINDYQAAASAAEAGLEACVASEEVQRTMLRARGHRLLGAALAMDGSNLPVAEDHLQQAIAAHRLTDNVSDLCATLFELGNVAAQRGQLHHALEYYDEAALRASSAHVYYFQALAYNNYAYHCLLLGRIEPAQQSIMQARKLAETHELLGALLHIFSTQGEIQLYLGEWAAASELFQHGLALAEELGNLERQAGYRAGLALAARGQNDVERAATLLEEALMLLVDRGNWHLRTRIQLWLAEIQLFHGNISEAEPHIEDALSIAKEHGRLLLQLQGERLQARILAAQGDWLGADALFRETFKRASELDLALEVARTQVAWGETALLYAPVSRDWYTLLVAGRQIFAAYDAHGELQDLAVLL
jgi:DNA-binding SARP family transcriptional activator